MNYRTFLVCFVLVLPIQLDKISKGTSLGAVEYSVAFLMSGAIAFFWAFVASWIRNKYASNLSDSYIKKIQLALGIIGLLLTINVIFNPKQGSEEKKLSMIDEASVIADLVITLEAECKSINPKNNHLCESLSEKVTDCIGGYRKTKDQLNSVLEVCRGKLSKEFGG